MRTAIVLGGAAALLLAAASANVQAAPSGANQASGRTTASSSATTSGSSSESAGGYADRTTPAASAQGVQPGYASFSRTKAKKTKSDNAWNFAPFGPVG